jgi:hypothetical protein
MKQAKSIAAKNNLSKTSVASLVSGHTTVVQITLWGRSDSAREHSPDNVYSPSPAAQMVCDLVNASNGELLARSNSGISASYKSVRQAVTAVRHMQQLVKGFSEAAAAGPLYTSFTLQYADQLADSSDGDLSLVPSRRSESEAVFLVGNICSDARSIPGLRFKENTSTPQKNRGQVLELLSPTRSPQPLAVPSRIEIAPRVKTPSSTAVASPSMVQPQVISAAGQRLMTAVKVPQAAKPVASFAILDFLASAKTTLANAFRSRVVVGALVGVASVVFLGATIRHFAQSKPQQQAQPLPLVRQPATPNPAPIAPAPSTAPAESVTAAPPTNTAGPPPSSPSVPALKPVVAPSPKPRPDPKEPAPDKPQEASTKYTEAEIDHMIARADKLAGDGSYDKAIFIYNMVLKQEGRNSAALSGRDRAIRNLSHK